MSANPARRLAYGQLFSAPTRPTTPDTLPFPARRAQDGLLRFFGGARAPRGLRRALICARGESQQCADIPSTPYSESRSAVWQVPGDSQGYFLMVPNAAKGARRQQKIGGLSTRGGGLRADRSRQTASLKRVQPQYPPLCHWPCLSNDPRMASSVLATEKVELFAWLWGLLCACRAKVLAVKGVLTAHMELPA